jgi:hypothetical protein
VKEMGASGDGMGLFHVHSDFLSFFLDCLLLHIFFPYLHHVLWMDSLLPGLHAVLSAVEHAHICRASKMEMPQKVVAYLCISAIGKENSPERNNRILPFSHSDSDFQLHSSM